MGYVGCISAACFARSGHEVIGCDVSQVKVDMINRGRSPIVEPGVEELLADAVDRGRLRATTSPFEALDETELSLVCVGTPSQPNGSLDLKYLKSVCQEIGQAISKKKRAGHVVVIRSTMLPGTMHETIMPTIEVYSGKRHGKDFHLAINPEFLREGTSIYDFDHPPFTLIGADTSDAAEYLSLLYSIVEAPLYTCGIKEAEMVKYACNCFHATKVVFANEIGNICKKLGVDSHVVMDIFTKDTKLNLSPYYLKPGFAYGGPCLPKDLRAIIYKAKMLDVEAPLLASLDESNRKQVDKVVRQVLHTNKKRVGVLGLSFKTGTDDLRESPMVAMVEALIGKGITLAIYDREVQLARLFGANKEYIEHGIPHISSLLRDNLDEVLAGAEVLIVAKASGEFRAIAEKIRKETLIIDLVRIADIQRVAPNYDGLCW
jgi:GDP-mannose 6-dehydrogenase